VETVVNHQHLSACYKNKKVFVTGHTGFKGAWLCGWLHQLGAVVKGYALEPEHKEGLYNLMEPLDLVESVIADVRDKERLEKELLTFAPDFIFHLAAQPLVRRSYEVPSETFEVNVVGTANLLEAVKKVNNRCAVVIITTDKVYENIEKDILYKEGDVLGGYDPYSASKACTEIVVSSFRNSFFNKKEVAKHQKGIATARAGNVIGGGDFSNDRIVPDIVRALQLDKTIELRNPHAIRPWQHVLEPLGGYLILAEKLYRHPQDFSEAFNFGPIPSDHLEVAQLADIAVRSWGHGNFVSNGSSNQPHEANLLKLDISKAEAMLQWTPKLNASQAIDWTMKWYKKDWHNALVFSFEQIENYMRL
jgi:CDP-glucose 4,6-dehydratase